MANETETAGPIEAKAEEICDYLDCDLSGRLPFIIVDEKTDKLAQLFARELDLINVRLDKISIVAGELQGRYECEHSMQNKYIERGVLHCTECEERIIGTP